MEVKTLLVRLMASPNWKTMMTDKISGSADSVLMMIKAMPRWARARTSKMR
jgi:hypothetical protein